LKHATTISQNHWCRIATPLARGSRITWKPSARLSRPRSKSLIITPTNSNSKSKFCLPSRSLI
jgi:hypothetical protein